MANRSKSFTAALMQVLSLLPVLLGGFAVTAPLPAHAAAPIGETRYLCCNMRFTRDRFNDINYDEEGSTLLPYGTPVRILELSQIRMRLEINGAYYKFNNDFSRKLGMSEFIKRYLLVDDPRPAHKNLPESARQAIEAFTVVPGMTREQVLLAVAYPIADETPDLKSDVWKYWQIRTIEYDVKFDASGVVTDVVVIDDFSHDDDEVCPVNVYRTAWARNVDGAHMRVQVDGQPVGRLRTSDTVCLKLAPGKHKVEIRHQILFMPAGVVAEMDVDVPDKPQPQFLRFHRTFATRGELTTELTTATQAQWRKRE